MAAPTALQSWLPATFQERGVAVPFTTPLLAQARARASRQGGIELVMANPSGGRGSYVLRPEDIGGVARLTVHDRLLLERLGGLPALTPASLRMAAREVAATGVAGREAAHAAAQATAQEARERVQANLLLMVALLRQAGHAELAWQRMDLADAATQASLKTLLAPAAQGLGVPLDRLLSQLDEIALQVVPVGFAGGPFASRAARSCEALERFAHETRDWVRLEPDDRRAGVELIAGCAAATLARARACLERLWSALDAVPNLLRLWSADRGAVVDRLALPDWLLDGWPYICAAWDQATSEDRSAQRAALARIEPLVPLLPGEQAAAENSPQERLRQRRWLKAREDLRSAATAAVAVGRNEMLRAALP